MHGFSFGAKLEKYIAWGGDNRRSAIMMFPRQLNCQESRLSGATLCGPVNLENIKLSCRCSCASGTATLGAWPATRETDPLPRFDTINTNWDRGSGATPLTTQD